MKYTHRLEDRYLGYQGLIDWFEEDKCFYGKINIADLVTFEGDTILQVIKAFREAVDEYLYTCIELDKKPEEPK